MDLREEKSFILSNTPGPPSMVTSVVTVSALKKCRVCRYAFVLIAICALVAVGFYTTGEYDSAPYPPSRVIRSVHWSKSSLLTAAPGSDLWPVAWASDGNLYTAWGDGGGFGGDNRRGRVSTGIARLTGTPPDFTPTNINGGVGSEVEPTWGCSDCGKTAGLLSVDGVLYAWVNMQGQTSAAITQHSRLAWSSDLGRTWTYSDWSFPDTRDDRFQPSTFVRFGMDYAGASDRYVYSYGGRWVYSQGPENSLYLMRADRAQLRYRNAWQFFTGFDDAGNPRWSSDIRSRHPVFTDPRGVNNLGLASVVYNRALQRFILTVAHRPDRSTGPAPDAGHLGIFDAPTPWGPWSTVAYYHNWLRLGGSEALIYEIPAKWIGPAGKRFWMIFSSSDRDSFNLIHGEFELADDTLAADSLNSRDTDSGEPLQP